MSVDELGDERKSEPKVAYIGEGVVFKGELAAPELVIVDGTIEGELTARCVRVGVSGELKGTVTVTDADIRGTVSDKLEVKQLLIVRSTGRVEAAITYSELQIEKGAMISGPLSSTDVRSTRSDQGQVRTKIAPTGPSAVELKRTATP